MALEKHTAYRNMPYSSETPSDGHHTFVTVRELIRKVTDNIESVFLCRAVGTITIVGTPMYFHEIEDSSVKVYLSLQHTKKKSPYLILPYAVHLCGFAHWEESIGVVLFAQTICAMSSYLALQLRHSMRHVLDNFFSPSNHDLENDPALVQLRMEHDRHLTARRLEELELATGIRRSQLPPEIPMDYNS